LAGLGESLNNGELDLRVPELVALSSLDVFSLVQHSHSNDLNGVSVGLVVSTQFRVELGDSSIDSDVPVFLVHVDHLGSASILAHDAIGLNGSLVLFEDLTHLKDLTIGFLQLVLSLHFVPEVALSIHFVLGEHSHSECLGELFSFADHLSTGHQELSNVHHHGLVTHLFAHLNIYN
jgi:hypothetical protein